jgi:hypothetical protein
MICVFPFSISWIDFWLYPFPGETPVGGVDIHDRLKGVELGRSPVELLRVSKRSVVYNNCLSRFPIYDIDGKEGFGAEYAGPITGSPVDTFI